MKREFFLFFILFHFKGTDLHLLVEVLQQIPNVIRIPYFSVIVHYSSTAPQEFNPPLCKSVILEESIIQDRKSRPIRT